MRVALADLRAPRPVARGTHVRAVTPQQYESYIAQRKREIDESNREAARQREAVERRTP